MSNSPSDFPSAGVEHAQPAKKECAIPESCRHISDDVSDSIQAAIDSSRFASEQNEVLNASHLIFVVDDTPMVRDLVRDLLTAGMDNIRVRTFSDGLQAMEAINSGDEIPSLIVSDFDMPNMNGVELCSNIQNLEQDIRPLVVIMTGSSVDKLNGSFSKAGAYTVVQKPFKLDELMEATKSALDAYKAARSTNCN